jgi:cytochrome c biogenesis protein CcdA
LATVSPCAFVMLPSFLALSLGAAEGREQGALLSRCAHRLAMGLVVSAAFSAVLVFAGLVLAAGMRVLVDAIPWLAVAVGVGLVIAGVVMVAGRELGLAAVRRLGPQATTGRGYAQAATFGVGYAVASLSCSIAVVLAVASRATTTASPAQILGVFGAFAAGATSALLALSLSIALAYWIPELLGHNEAGAGPLEEATRTLSSTVANFLAGHTGAFAIGLAVIAAIGAGLAAATHSPTARPRHPPSERLPPRRRAAASTRAARSARRRRPTPFRHTRARPDSMIAIATDVRRPARGAC